MQYELFFWAMLTVVASASAGGILLGRIRSIRVTLLGCFLLSCSIAGALSIFLSRMGMPDAMLLSAVASFLFSAVIASAFALLVRRFILRVSVA